MSAWTVVPCLVALRAEFNKLSPNRDKGADGTIGDSNHTSTSDHSADEDSDALRGKDADSVNEVHALDIDSTGPWPGTTFHALVMSIVARCRSGAENRLRYIIHNGVIYHVDDDFAGKVYTGPDPHTNHAHFSASYVSAREADTRPWGIWEDTVLDTDDKNWLGGAIATKTQLILDRLTAMEASLPQRNWDVPRLINAYSGVAQSPGDILRYAPSRQGHLDTLAAVAQLSTTLGAFIAAEATDDATRAAAQAQMQQALDGLAATVTAQVIAALPEGSDQVSQEEVTTAVREAFRNAAWS